MSQCTIRTFQKVLGSFNFEEPSSFSENFAMRRFRKKFQKPDESVVARLHNECWEDWLASDESLPEIELPPKQWYMARDFLHKNLGVPQLKSIGFPKGSEFIPTRGQNSLEAKLIHSTWTCTHDNFELFSKICYRHKALKRAVRKRFTRWFKRQRFNFSMKSLDNYLFNLTRKAKRSFPFLIFQWKLEKCVSFVQGSRFSTVYKNNDKRRPINIEPTANIIVQRTLGNWIRKEILRIYNIDLNQLASTHRLLIKGVDLVATIDLKNASDRISLELCRFLFPKRLMNIIEASRSFMCLGLDKDYHVLRKVSSMGNGFTFELMTLILTCLARQLDGKASVFGDDIIIQLDKADELVHLLESVGLQVNLDKSFTTGDFRESCGANYHRTEGYVKSFDFKYPESIGDCCIIMNKAAYLAQVYPSFHKLYVSLSRTLPVALQGGPDPTFLRRNPLELLRKGIESDESFVNFPLFFVTAKLPKKQERSVPTVVLDRLADYGYDGDFRLVRGFEFKPKLRSPTLRHLPSHRWAKYEMYLAAGRRSKDVLSGEGKWKSIWFVTSGVQNFRVASLMIDDSPKMKRVIDENGKVKYVDINVEWGVVPMELAFKP